MPHTLKEILVFILVFPFLILLFPLVILLVAFRLLMGFFLYLAIWLTWSTRGRRVLFVYSNSPNWQEYIERRILPRLPQNTIIMNWSERRKWSKLSLPVHAFHYFCGGVNCSPAAVIFRPFHMARTFRFWQPFKDYKHGKPDPLARLERQMFDYIELK
jgi:hypothetical protein